MDEKDIIAMNITHYRKKLGLSQLELAEKLQYSNKNISKWEKGETTPSIFTLKRLAEIFSISLDALTLKPFSENESEPQPTAVSNQTDATTELKTPKKEQSFKIKLTFLLMANAILLFVALIVIYVLSTFTKTSFKKWLILLYITPLSALSVTIFIRCIFKYVDFISLSFIVWLSALSIFLTLIHTPNIYYVFFIAAAAQLLLVCIALLVNFHLYAKFKKRFFKKKKKSENATTADENIKINEK